jgi:hypothetical protein
VPERYKFGDIVEWSTARWMILYWTGKDSRPDMLLPNHLGYDAVWLGWDKSTPKSVDAVGDIGRICVDYGPPYLVSDD